MMRMVSSMSTLPGKMAGENVCMTLAKRLLDGAGSAHTDTQSDLGLSLQMLLSTHSVADTFFNGSFCSQNACTLPQSVTH